MMNRIFMVLVIAPLAILLVALAVANRAPVVFTLDPFDPGNPRLSFEVPLFALLFAALALGMVGGSLVTWFKQRRYRKLAKARETAARRPASTGTALSSQGS